MLTSINKEQPAMSWKYMFLNKYQSKYTGLEVVCKRLWIVQRSCVESSCKNQEKLAE